MANNRELSELADFLTIDEGVNNNVGIATTVRISPGGLYVDGVEVIGPGGAWKGPNSGLVGAQGTQGAQGYQGVQGEVGAQGAQGYQGVQGAQGDPGGVGSQGAQGAQGYQGVQGASGIDAYGITYNFDSSTTAADPGTGDFRFSIDWTTGTPGSSYSAYVSETDNNSTGIGPLLDTLTDSSSVNKALVVLYKKNTPTVNAKFYVTGQTDNGSWRTLSIEYIDRDNWASISNGDEVFMTVSIIGDAGSAGAQGAQGAQGVQGAAGAQGAQGVQGAVGAQGNQGVQGAVGAQGDAGAVGAQGAQGVQGAQGRQGAVGAQGAQGAQGVQGDTGAGGSVGAQGAQGVQGAQGRQGATGAQGVQGANGVAPWSQDAVGLSTITQLGVNTTGLAANTNLVGIGNSFQGVYVSNGMYIFDNHLEGNHYIGTAFNGLMAGPVTVNGTLTVDGVWVVV